MPPFAVGSPPSPRPNLTYLALRNGFRFLARHVFGFRMRLEGAEHLPVPPAGVADGGWIAAGFPHRTWVDPFVVIALLPADPRFVFFADGRTITRSRLRSMVASRLGGIIPIWPGAGREAVDAYVAAASSAVEVGAVFLLFPETGPPVPVPEARPFGHGLGYFALRTGAPIVPLVLGGTHELFRGRRIVLRALPPVTARELAGLAGDEPIPEPWSRAERLAASHIVAELQSRTRESVAAAHASVEPKPGRRKQWLRLTHMWQ